MLKLEKAMPPTQTDLVPSILPHAHISVVIIVFTLVKTHFESMTNYIYKTCLDRKATMAITYFPQFLTAVSFLFLSYFFYILNNPCIVL